MISLFFYVVLVVVLANYSFGDRMPQTFDLCRVESHWNDGKCHNNLYKFYKTEIKIVVYRILSSPPTITIIETKRLFLEKNLQKQSLKQKMVKHRQKM